MRICVLANARSAHTQRWARAYTARGHDVHVVSIRQDDISGASVHSVYVGRANGTGVATTFLSYLRLLVSLPRILRGMQPDIVHAHYTVTHGVIAAASGFRPFLLSAWGTDVAPSRSAIGSYVKGRLNRYALNRASAVTSSSHYMIPLITALANGPIEVHRIPFGIDLEVFAPRPARRSETISIGFVKHLKTNYQPSALVDAFAALVADGTKAQLILAGEGELLSELRLQAERLSISHLVKFTGRVDHRDVPQLVQSFDILVNPSLTESFGVAILEASACEVPVVATAVGGVPEVAQDGVTAFLVEPGNQAALNEALRRLAADAALRDRLGVAGREFVAEHYDWNSSVDSMLAVITTAVEAAT